MSRMTSRGVKWSPASSLACSLKRMTRCSKRYPIWRFEMPSGFCGVSGVRSTAAMSLTMV